MKTESKNVASCSLLQFTDVSGDRSVPVIHALLLFCGT